MAYEKQRSFLFSGSRDYSVKCWDVNAISTSSVINTTAENNPPLPPSPCLMEFSAPRNIVTALHIDNKNSPHLLYQCSEDLSIRVWDTRCNNNGSSNKIPAIHITGFVYFPLCVDTCDYLVSTGCKGIDGVGGEVKLFDLRFLQSSSSSSSSGSKQSIGSSLNKTTTFHQPLAVFAGHQHDVTGCKFTQNSSDSNNSNYIVSMSKDGTCRAWNYNSSVDCANLSTPTAATSRHNNDANRHLVVNSIDKSYTCMSSGVVNNNNTCCFYLGAMDGSVSKLDFSNLGNNTHEQSSASYKNNGMSTFMKFTSNNKSDGVSSTDLMDCNESSVLQLTEISTPYFIKGSRQEDDN